MENINGFDLFILSVIGLSALLSYSRGFTREMLGIGSWILTSVLTIYGAPRLEPTFAAFFPKPLFASILSYLFVFCVSLVLLTIVYSKISKVVQRSALSGLDNFLGFLFGVVRGIFLLVLFYLFVSVLSPKTISESREESILLPYLEIVAQDAKEQILKETQDMNLPKKPEKMEELILMLGDQTQGRKQDEKKSLFDLEALKKSFLSSGVPSDNGKKSSGNDLKKETGEPLMDDALKRMLEEDDALFQMLNAPSVKNEGKEAKEGYDRKEREDLNRLIMEATDDPGL